MAAQQGVEDERKRYIFVELQCSMREFSDEVVSQDQFEADVHNIAYVPLMDVEVYQNNNVPQAADMQAAEGSNRYKVTDLNPNQIVRSSANFGYNKDGSSRIALIKQDSTGKVTGKAWVDNQNQNQEPEKLSAEDEAKVAFKIAEMAVASYLPGGGDFVIRGKNTQLANRVHAALLLILEHHPYGNNIKINVCVLDAGKPGWFKSRFIERYLGEGVMPKDSRAAEVDKMKQLDEKQYRQKENQTFFRKALQKLRFVTPYEPSQISHENEDEIGIYPYSKR